jgi:catechol 2,3-dioxygenase-like lactoylglutathione lyase family enzyme
MSTDVVPIFRVADAARSVEWYGRLGFEQVFEHRFAPGLPAYVGIRRDDAQIHLSEHTGDASPESLVYVWVDAVDPLAALFGAEIDEMPWGRDFEIADPDGNRLRIAEPAPAE